MMILDMISRQILVHFGPECLINPYDRRYWRRPPILLARDLFKTFRWDHRWPSDAVVLRQVSYDDACDGPDTIRSKIKQVHPFINEHEVDRLVLAILDVIGYTNTLHAAHRQAIDFWQSGNVDAAWEQINNALSLEMSYEGQAISSRILRRELFDRPLCDSDFPSDDES